MALSFSSLCVCAEEVEDTSQVLELELDSSSLVAVTNLARSLAGVNATQATVDDNVASILSFVNKLRFLNSGYTGKEYYLYTEPMWRASYTLAQLLENLFAGGTNLSPSSAASQSYLKRIFDILDQWPQSASSSVWTTNDVVTLLGDLTGFSSDFDSMGYDLSQISLHSGHIDSQLTDYIAVDLAQIYNILYNYTFDNLSALWVHEVNSDDEVSYLGQLASESHTIGLDMLDGFHTIDQRLREIHLTITNALAEDYTVDITNALDLAATEVESANEQAEADVEKQFEEYEIQYPTYDRPSEREVSSPSDNLGLSSVSTDLNHGRTILFHPHDISISGLTYLPRMEYDLGRDSATASAVDSISRLVRLGWSTLFGFFTFLLYLQTYRRARAMLLHTQSAGTSAPSLTLGFASDFGVV